MIMLANVWTITMKYILNCIDLRSETPWENKSIWGLYVDLTAGVSTDATPGTTFHALTADVMKSWNVPQISSSSSLMSPSSRSS